MNPTTISKIIEATETDSLIPETNSIQNYTTITQEDPETGLLVITQQEEKKPWLWKSNSYAWSLVTLVLLLVTFTTFEYVLLKLNLPAVNSEDKDGLKFPKSLEDLRRLNEILSVYMNKNFMNVYVTFVISYIYLQSFSIPGSMWLSILGGALFNFWLALFTVSMCSAIGATIAYIISGSLGSKAVMRLIGSKRLIKWNEQLVQHKAHMFNYMIVLRIAPFPPNWTVNLGSPHLGIPMAAFFWGTLIGVASPSFIHVQAGAALDRLSSSDKLELLTVTNVACLFAVCVVVLIPVMVRRKFNNNSPPLNGV